MENGRSISSVSLMNLLSARSGMGNPEQALRRILRRPRSSQLSLLLRSRRGGGRRTRWATCCGRCRSAARLSTVSGRNVSSLAQQCSMYLPRHNRVSLIATTFEVCSVKILCPMCAFKREKARKINCTLVLKRTHLTSPPPRVVTCPNKQTAR